MRLFVAVNFTPATRTAIAAALDDFPVANPPWRWSTPESWHLTLKFMGETSEPEAERAIAALERVRARHAPFDLTLGRFGAFPSLAEPRVLFYAVDRGARELSALARDVDAALAAAVGLETERRPFHAHATVARVKNAPAPAVVASLKVVPALVTPVDRVSVFELMESRLGRAGAQYSVVKEFAMPGTPC